MASVTRGRRLPARVYWVRRAVVFAVALVLVFGIAKLLTLGSGSPDADQASPAAARPSGSTSSQPMGPTVPSTTAMPTQKSQASMIEPSGECSPDGISVLPSVPKAVAGGPIAIQLRLEGTSPACTFPISPDSLAIKIVNDHGKVWSTQDCARAIAPDSVVVRSGVPTMVRVLWDDKYSDSGCPGGMPWATQGFYHVYAAAQGSTPTDVQFEVTLPTSRRVTRTAHPHPTSTSSATPTPTPRPSPSPTGKRDGGSACGGDNAAGTC